MARTQALMLQIATGDPRPISKQIVDAVRMRQLDLDPADPRVLARLRDRLKRCEHPEPSL